MSREIRVITRQASTLCLCASDSRAGVFVRDAKEPKPHLAVEARYLVRGMSGSEIRYRMGAIADSEGRALVAPRAIAPSPFPNDTALFPGGFDCNDQPCHSTGWIYRGEIKTTKQSATAIPH